jgi:DNA-binding beta-propeller fold protein YncE
MGITLTSSASGEKTKFIWVTCIAFNQRGQLFLADENTHRISIFSVDGQYLRCFGQRGSSDGRLDRPSGIAFDQNDNIYVVGSLNHRVQKFTQHGEFLAKWGSKGSGEGQLNMPWGIAVDCQGDVYITDWRNDRVQKFTTDGRFIMTFGSSGAGEDQLNRPNGITVDAEGNIYVCDWMNDRVQVFDPHGDYQDTLIGHSGVSRWARSYLDDNPDIEEKLERAVQNIEPKKRFYRPVSVKVDEDGKVYVADCYRHRVQIYQKLSTADP